MVQQNLLGLIIAKALVFIDAIMECFVDVSLTGGALLNCYDNYCGIAGTAYSGTLTACGLYVEQQLTVSLIALTGLFANILPALSIR